MSEIKTNSVSPFLKWAGGKRWFAKSLGDFIPGKFNRLIEPFLGSAAVFFYLAPDNAILSDVNGDLIETYQAIKDNWKAVYDLLQKHHDMHNREHYYTVRSDSPKGKNQRAARFIYLNRTCWNGLYRVNKEGRFNVPIGTRNNVIHPTDDFKAISQRLKNATIEHCDFEKSLSKAGDGDLVFLDPPYTIHHNVNGFIQYNEKLFHWDDQIRLRDHAKKAIDRGAVVVISNAHHQSILELYEEGFEIMWKERHSVISGKALGRKVSREYIIVGGV